VRLFSWVRRRALLVWLLTTALSLAGLVSAAAMPSGIYPEVEFRRIVVLARMGGAPPEAFETAVTRPLEQALASVMGVERMRSKTIRGAVEISLQLVPGTDVWQALQMTEARANEVRASLGADAEVIVERVTTGSFPVVTFNVSGAVDPRELRELSENLLGPAISGVPGVGNVEISGGDVREVEIVLDPEATASLGLSASSVAERVRGGMGLHAVGRLNRDRQLVTIVSDAEPRSLAEIRDLPVTTRGPARPGRRTRRRHGRARGVAPARGEHTRRRPARDAGPARPASEPPRGRDRHPGLRPGQPGARGDGQRARRDPGRDPPVRGGHRALPP
jgi:multidrug efflux pump subunit AcrB